MKSMIGAALITMTLIGSVATASTVPVPDPNAPIQEQLRFWNQFNDRD
jgi:hypothetical protein